jgi:hypothetical protein
VRIGWSARRRPFDFAKGTPRLGAHPPDNLELEAAIEAIASAPVEVGYGFDAASRQVFRHVGTENELRGVRQRDLERIRDGTFLHNHPPYPFPAGDPRRRPGSFTEQDLIFMYEQNLAELLVVTEHRLYRLRRRPEGFFLDPTELQREYGNLLAEIESSLRAQVMAGVSSVDEAVAKGRLADEVMDRLGVFFDYSVEKRG